VTVADPGDEPHLLKRPRCDDTVNDGPSTLKRPRCNEIVSDDAIFGHGQEVLEIRRETLKIDFSAVFSDVKFQLFKEINKICGEMQSVGVDISDHLDEVRGELMESINEYALELKEVIADECAVNSIELVDDPLPAYDFPDDWNGGGLVTCKKCLFQWDGYAQHLYD
jgi:hypothetical protein